MTDARDRPGRFGSPQDVVERLRTAGYLADDRIGLTVFIADRLDKPVLVEGPAGVGKTELARTIATVTGARLIRLQCYEGLDEAKALYEWNYKKQLLRIQADEHRESWSDLEEDIFSESFLLPRPLLAAIRADEPVVLLIDEIDRVEVEAEALMLEVLADFQVTIPELGTVPANTHPMVFLTSNDTRDLSEALKRRCLYLRIDYPSLAREREILLAQVPSLGRDLAEQVATIVRSIRGSISRRLLPYPSPSTGPERSSRSESKPSPRRSRRTRCMSSSSTRRTSRRPAPS